MHINLFDSHIHSDHSPDGHDPAIYLCEKAVEKGITGIAITDHCDINHYERDQYHLRMQQSHFESRIARDIFRQRLIVALGIEIGQPLENPALAAQVLKDHAYDFVLASVHNLPGEEDFYVINFQERDPVPLLDAYFEQLIQTAWQADFDSLAHLCFPLRYLRRDGVKIDMSRYEEAHDEVFRALATRGKALELNTADVRRGGEITPTLAHLKRFREFGGKLVTIGSDAHLGNHVGSDIFMGMEFLDEAGFDYFAFYRSRIPCMLKVL